MSQNTTTNTLHNIQSALSGRSNNISNAKSVDEFVMYQIQRNYLVTQVEFVQTGVESDIDESALEIISPFVTQGEFVQTGVERALEIIGTISASPPS